MALETSDVFPVQKTDGGTGSVRKATIGALLSLAQTTAGYWQRTGSILSPVNTDDDLSGIGNLSAINGTFTGTLEADSIDGGEYAV